MIGFYTKFTTAEGDRDTLVALLLEAAKGMKSNADCVLYIVSKDEEDIATTWVTELWKSADEHKASLGVPGAKERIAKAMPLLAIPPEQTKLTPMGGKGI
jgi:quinol monooxygenase YgiN